LKHAQNQKRPLFQREEEGVLRKKSGLDSRLGQGPFWGTSEKGNTSSPVKGAVNCSFIAWDTFRGTVDRTNILHSFSTFSSIEMFQELIRHPTHLLWRLSVTTPSGLLRLVIVFFFFRLLALWWKKRVFLSPSVSHCTRYLCLHIISSRWCNSTRRSVILISAWDPGWFIPHARQVLVQFA
jgi:hypothetical protein